MAEAVVELPVWLQPQREGVAANPARTDHVDLPVRQDHHGADFDRARDIVEEALACAAEASVKGATARNAPTRTGWSAAPQQAGPAIASPPSPKTPIPPRPDSKLVTTGAPPLKWGPAALPARTRERRSPRAAVAARSTATTIRPSPGSRFGCAPTPRRGRSSPHHPDRSFIEAAVWIQPGQEEALAIARRNQDLPVRGQCHRVERCGAEQIELPGEGVGDATRPQTMCLACRSGSGG